MDITIPLQKPDFQILKWSNEESRSSDEAKILGAPLQKGVSLYKDLQRTYFTNTEANQQKEVKLDQKHKCKAPNEDKDAQKMRKSSEEEDGYAMAETEEQFEHQSACAVEESSVMQEVKQSSGEDDGYVVAEDSGNEDDQLEVKHSSEDEDGYVVASDDQLKLTTVFTEEEISAIHEVKHGSEDDDGSYIVTDQTEALQIDKNKDKLKATWVANDLNQCTSSLEFL